MWGTTPRTNPDTIKYRGDTLRNKYIKEELWLRSDVVRLSNIFNIATPDKVELEQTKKQLNFLQLKNSQLEELTTT